jgi:acyl carrier protein
MASGERAEISGAWCYSGRPRRGSRGSYLVQNSFNQKIRELLAAQETLDASKLADDSDLYDAGLTSFASVQLMLALEDSFAIEFPERMLNRRTFASIANIEQSLRELVPAEAA